MTRGEPCPAIWRDRIAPLRTGYGATRIDRQPCDEAIGKYSWVQRRELTMPSNSILARRPHWRKRLRCKLFARYRANGVFERRVTGRAPPRSGQPISAAGPLLVAMLAGFAGVALIMVWRTALEDTLYIPHRQRSRTDPRRRCARCGVAVGQADHRAHQLRRQSRRQG